MSTICLSSSSRYTHPSAHASPLSSRNRATLWLDIPVTSAPTSMSARAGGSATATARSRDSTSQSSARNRVVTTSGSASVAKTFASVPVSNLGAPSSSGSRSAGVPENPSRRGKSRSPPSSWPVALSFMPWCLAVSGNTCLSR